MWAASRTVSVLSININVARGSSKGGVHRAAVSNCLYYGEPVHFYGVLAVIWLHPITWTWKSVFLNSHPCPYKK